MQLFMENNTSNLHQSDNSQGGGNAMNINELRLGTVPLSSDVLTKANIGLWAFELDEGSEPRMYVDNTMLRLLGLKKQISPEETYHAWYDNVDDDSYGLVTDAVDKMGSGNYAEVQYPWHHPDGSTMIVRCGGTLNPNYTKGLRIEGTHQNVTEVAHYDEAEMRRQKEAERVQARARAVESMKRSMDMVFALSNEYDPIIVIEPESGRYDWYLGRAEEIERNTSMSVHGEDFYEDNAKDAVAVIREEDREQFAAFFSRENLLRIAKTGEVQESENRWFVPELNEYRWKYNKAVRMVAENGKVLVVVGVIDTTEKKAKEEETANIIKNFIKDYGMAFKVNINDDSYEMLKYSDDVFNKELVFDNFTGGINYMAENIVFSADRERFRRLLQKDVVAKAMADSDTYSIEFRVFIDGNTRWDRMTITLFDNNNVLVGFSALGKEIIYQRFENKLNDDFYALFSLDLDTEMISCFKNASWYKDAPVGGCAPYKIVMKAFADALEGEQREFFNKACDLDLVRNTLAKEDKQTYTYQSVIDGKPQWVTASMYVIDRHDDGTPAVSVLGFSFLDTMGADREELQWQLKEALKRADEDARRIEVTFEMSNANRWAYAINDKDEVVGSKVDAQATEVYNTSTEEEPMAWLDTIHPDDRARAENDFWAAIRDHSGQFKYDSTFRAFGKGGELHWVKSSGRVLRYDDGTAEMFGMSVDVTPEIEQQEKQQKLLQEAFDAAQEASKAKTRFMNSMSHDIRTPMNAIIGYTSMAQKFLDDGEKVKDYLGKIGRAGNNLLELVNQVLDMSRIESGNVILADDPADLVEKAYEMAELTKHLAEMKDIQIQTVINKVKNRKVYADGGRVNQLVLNIIGNAIKYTPQGGKIIYTITEMKCDKPGYGTYLIEVEDNGIGMSKEFLDTIFDPFSRENTSTVSKIQGSGLGMSIVKKLVDLMGGDIAVESEQGKGTKISVTLTFRLQEKKDDNADKMAPDHTMIVLRGKRALLVEDNEMNREIATMILEEQDIIVETAEDGDIAVEKMKELIENGNEGYYDFILMDVQMPRMNGYEATRAIRKIESAADSEGKMHIPIIAMTANAFTEDRQAAFASGMDDHVAKPIDVQMLWNVLAKYAK